MIIYFSATGNCQYVSKQIAKEINDTAHSMIDYEIDDICLDKNESLGIVIPTYFWGLPTIVDEYLSKINITSKDENPYIFIVTTYGTTPGYSASFVEEHINRCGYTVNLSVSVKMVDTWTVIFNLSDKEKIVKQTTNSDKKIKKIITRIKNKNEGNYVERKMPKFLANIAQLWYDKSRKTENLSVNSTCIQCMKCVNNCPIHAIEFKNNTISWNTEYCVMCLRCLHSCPEFSIQYNNKTQKHGQYINPYIKNLD